MKRDLSLVFMTGAIVFICANIRSSNKTEDEAPKNLRVNSLEIVDKQGNPRIKLFLTADGDPEITLSGSNRESHPMLRLSATDNGSAIFLLAKDSDTVVSIANDRIVSSFSVWDYKTNRPFAEIGAIAKNQSFLKIERPSTLSGFNIVGDSDGRLILHIGGPEATSGVEIHAPADKPPTISATDKAGKHVSPLPEKMK